MSNSRNTGFLTNVIKVDATGNVSFVSGSTTLATINTSGQMSGSAPALSSSYALSASYVTNAETLDGLDSTVFTLTSSFNTLSSSLSTTSGSFNTRVSALEATGSALSSSILSVSASSYLTSGSLSSASGSFNSRISTVESKYATTGSNTFTAPQHVTDTTVPVGFADSTGSIYTDGGLLVTKDSYFSGSVYIKGNVTVYGTQSIAYISSSQLNIGTNVITVNTSTPSVRFGGLSVFDSGSTNSTGSIFWDSQNNHWLYSRESGSTYGGGMLISGPRRANGTNMGDEQGTTACMLLVGQGGDHLTSSMIYHDSTVTCVGTGASITSAGAACFASSITANAASTINGAYPQLILNNPTAGAGMELHFKDNGTLKSKIGALDDINSWQVYNGGAIRLTVNNSGNVGIGTSSPGSNLHIYSSGGPELKLTAGGSGTGGLRLIKGDSGTAYINNQDSAGMQFQIAGSTKMIIDSGGKVGIGTTDPGTSTLKVKPYSYASGTESVESLITAVLGDSATVGALLSVKNSGNRGSIGNASGSPLFRADFNDATAMIIDKYGNVGIGTNSPSGKLTVQASADGNMFSIRGSLSAYGCPNIIEMGQSGADGYMNIKDGAGNVQSVISGYSGTPTYFLSSVGIGTSSPISKLDISGSHTSGYGVVNIVSSNSALISLNSTTTYDVRLRYKYNGTDLWFAGMYDNDSYKFINGSNSTILTLAQSGVSTFYTTVCAAGHVSSEDVRIYRSASTTTGYINFGSTGTNYFGFDGSKYVVNGHALISGQLCIGNGSRIHSSPYNQGGYTGDGLWGATATPARIIGTGNESGFLLGYTDNGSGLYGASYGFQVSLKDGLNNCIDYNAIFMRNMGNGNIPFRITSYGNIYGNTKNFLIDHPLPLMNDTHHLVHTSIEGPQADLIYRGKVQLVEGKAEVNIDLASRMTDGTFEALCQDVQSYTTNESGWALTKSYVIGNILHIEAQDETADDTISWLVIGERNDEGIKNSAITDENGHVIVEMLKSEE